MAINNEDYFQISTDILNSFHKHRLPIDLYVFRDEISVLEPIYRKGGRITDAQVEELAELCANGSLFVARSDQHIYKEHMIQQLDLVLLDPHLTETEIAELCITGVVSRFIDYYDQPVADVMEPLYRDVMVVTEYLWSDKHHILPFVRRLLRKAHPARHAVNTMIVGTYLWLQISQNYTRRDLDRVMFALLMHDIGMCKIPQFLLTRPNKLKPDEWEKVTQHPILSVKLMQKTEFAFEELVHACFEHHERLDGSGYPQHLKADRISPLGKLTAVADSFAAMITERIYAKAKDPTQAANELLADKRYDRAIAGKLSAACLEGGALADLVDMDAKLEQALKGKA